MMASVKYLQRGSLWFVKSVFDGPERRYLLQMILWKEGCDQGRSRNDIHLGGKNLEMKAGKMALDMIPGCFSNYSCKETTQSLIQMAAFFKKLSLHVSAELNYTLPDEKISEIKKYIYQRIKRI